jgi:hypothetical protein
MMPPFPWRIILIGFILYSLSIASLAYQVKGYQVKPTCAQMETIN